MRLPITRFTVFLLLAVAGWLLAATTALAAGPDATRASLARTMASAGSNSGAMVVDLDSGETIYARNADTDRIPASNEKLYTTAATLLTLGAGNRPDTVAQTALPVGPGGVVTGDLYLRGNGDPTLSGAELRELAGAVRAAGVTEITGRVVGDDSLFDGRRGVGATRFRPDPNLAPVGALMVDRGRTGRIRPYYQSSPAAFAASALAANLRARGVDVAAGGQRGDAPDPGVTIASVQAPTYAELAADANVPSDNTVAETLLKAVGTDGFTRQGTTANGAALTAQTMNERFGISPRVADGSGLARTNRTSPRELVELLSGLRDTNVWEPFYDSLAVAGRSGTLAGRLRASTTRGRCRGKTGTLRDVSSLSGYCETRAGGTVAFAILMNRVNPSGGRVLQDRMVSVIARYSAGSGG